jgi:hypothetical protein
MRQSARKHEDQTAGQSQISKGEAKSKHANFQPRVLACILPVMLTLCSVV